MSRSYRAAIRRISKQWTNFQERQFRRAVKQSLAFDPDHDWEELTLNGKARQIRMPLSRLAPVRG